MCRSGKNNAGVNNVPIQPNTDVSQNMIGGNLQCSGNTPPPVTDNSGANTVQGTKQGQCAGL